MDALLLKHRGEEEKLLASLEQKHQKQLQANQNAATENEDDQFNIDDTQVKEDTPMLHNRLSPRPPQSPAARRNGLMLDASPVTGAGSPIGVSARPSTPPKGSV